MSNQAFTSKTNISQKTICSKWDLVFWWSSQKRRRRTGLSAGFPWPQCGIWHAGPSHIATKAWGHFWHFWHCASLIRVLLRGPWTVCNGWQGLVFSQPPSVRGSAGFGSWANPVHIVLQAPLESDMSSWVWLSQIRWWYPAVKGGSSRSISILSLWYPDLQWEYCRLDVQQQPQTEYRKDRSSFRCLYLPHQFGWQR